MLVIWTVQRQGQWMLTITWLLGRKVESVGPIDSVIAGSTNAYNYIITWLLGRKVEYVGHMDSTIAGSKNAHNYLTTR
jgi:hypothetical protein